MGLLAAKDTALWYFYKPFTGLEALQRVLGAFPKYCKGLHLPGTNSARNLQLELIPQAFTAEL